MPKYITLGIYTNEGAAGIVDGTSDRRAAMETMCNSVGAKLVGYDITRGQFDFCTVIEADSFEIMAAMLLKGRASGATSELVTLEAVDVDKIRGAAKSVQFTPPHGEN